VSKRASSEAQHIISHFRHMSLHWYWQ